MAGEIKKINIRFHGLSRLPAALAGLVAAGWTIEAAPNVRSLPRNGQNITLLAGSEDKRVRLFAYTVTDSSRNRPHERRVEITSTYGGGLTPSGTHADVVIAYERRTQGWVGLDSRRLSHGGDTHNASSFVPAGGFDRIERGKIVILPMETNLFESEFAAFFPSEQLAEYIFNSADIHAGTYNGTGIFSRTRTRAGSTVLMVRSDALHGEDIAFRAPESGRRQIALDNNLVSAFQNGVLRDVRGRELSREEFLELKRRCDEIGLNGERWVLSHERRRLKRAGRQDLAEGIQWISQTSPFAGFDILSFEPNGQRRRIEVKATVSNSRKFEMSENEWETARSFGAEYSIYRVTSIETGPSLKVFKDPIDLLGRGVLKRSPAGWLVEY